jgi:hypothetical protein
MNPGPRQYISTRLGAPVAVNVASNGSTPPSSSTSFGMPAPESTTFPPTETRIVPFCRFAEKAYFPGRVTLR